jgi:predicted RNA-binding Zn ribbon-like protein
VKFKFLGGHPAIDFVNTVGGRTYTTANRYTVDRDRLESVADFDEWLGMADLDGLKARHSTNDAVLERAIALRETLYRTFKAVTEQRRPDPKDSEIFNRELAEARAHEKLTFTGGKPSFIWDDRDAPELPLWIIARSAAELLTSPDIARVRACGGEDCGWLFLDTSRNRSRQWCDMADCGNVAKVRRFRDRQRESG